MTATFYAKLLLVSQGLLSAPMSTPRPAPAAGHELAANLRLSALAGQVTNELGAPLPGVVIAVQGSPTTASTNADGRFLVTAPADEPVLVFKCAGYRVQTVVAPTSGPLAVTMYALTGSGTDKTTTSGSTTPAASAPLIIADVMPAFKGGTRAYSEYLRQNAQFPAEALKQQVGGVVYISFVVDEQGRICDAEVLKGCGHGFDEEALRLVRLMPWWEPGQMGGKPVRVAHSLRIAFEARRQ